MPDAASPVPPNPTEVYKQVAALVAFLHPRAANVRIEYEVPDSDGGVTTGRLTVPADADVADLLDDLEGAVLTELGKLKPGEWMGGKAVAAAVGCDPEAGNFKRTMAKLAKPTGSVESNRNKGYRLRP